MNFAQKIAKESTITFFGMVYGNINRYLYTALLARWVGIEYLGIYALANSIMLISEVMGKMGMESGVMRFVSRLNMDTDSKNIQKIIASALKMTASFSLLIMIGLIFSARYIVTQILNGQPILTTVMIVFAVAIPFNALTSVSAFATQGFKRLKYKTLVIQFLNPTILLVSMILCFWFFSKESASQGIKTEGITSDPQIIHHQCQQSILLVQCGCCLFAQLYSKQFLLYL